MKVVGIENGSMTLRLIACVTPPDNIATQSDPSLVEYSSLQLVGLCKQNSHKVYARASALCERRWRVTTQYGITLSLTCLLKFKYAVHEAKKLIIEGRYGKGRHGGGRKSS